MNETLDIHDNDSGSIFFQASDHPAWFRSALPKNEYRLRANSHFAIDQPTRPNAWWRFWQWALLGWTWEEIP